MFQHFQKVQESKGKDLSLPSEFIFGMLGKSKVAHLMLKCSALIDKICISTVIVQVHSATCTVISVSMLSALMLKLSIQIYLHNFTTDPMNFYHVEHAVAIYMQS